MIYELNHFGIVIRDLEKSLAFYQGLFGAEIVFQSVIPSTRTDVVYLQIAGGLIELLHSAEPADDAEFGVTHIAFMSDALDDDYRRLVEAGYEGLVEPKIAGTGVGRLAFLRDPNGARVELLQREVTMRTAPIQHPIVTAFDHYSVIADDREAALRFYRDALGLRPLTTLTAVATDETIDHLHYDYDVLELVHPSTPSAGSIFAHIALRVADLDEAASAFAEAGVSLEAGSPRQSDTGRGRIGVIRDPDGVTIELLDRADLHSL